MKNVACSLLTLALLASPATAAAQAACGEAGADLVISGSQVINTYVPNPLATLSVPAGSTSLPVDASAERGPTPIGAGDLVLIIQMQGASIDLRNQDTVDGQFGDGPGGDILGNATVEENASEGVYRLGLAHRDVDQARHG